MVDISVSLLVPGSEAAYSDFLEKNSGALFYHSLKYRNFLKKILVDSNDLYFLAYQNAEIVGVLPTFIKKLADQKSIINSLPFFGSHGGVLISNSINCSTEVKKTLMDKLLNVVKQENTVSLTIIDNPTAIESKFYENYTQPSDQRISQITDISISNKNNIEDDLMAKFHYKTRNMIRKGMKSGFAVEKQCSLDAFKELYGLHSENMKVIGGKEKPFFVFKAIYENFESTKDYNIYFAKKNDEVAAVLLVFYYKNYCEYFTPVINQKYRSEQPLSLLIFQAMQDAVKKGCDYWNWGGTWLTQDGVYLFKKRWGATSQIYHYFNQIFDREYLKHSGEEMISNSYFYIYPTSKINK